MFRQHVQALSSPICIAKASPCLRYLMLAIVLQATGLKHSGDRSVNQDTFFCRVTANNSNIFIVCDGHGDQGKQAAAATSQCIPLVLDRLLRQPESQTGESVRLLLPPGDAAMIVKA